MKKTLIMFIISDALKKNGKLTKRLSISIRRMRSLQRKLLKRSTRRWRWSPPMR